MGKSPIQGLNPHIILDSLGFYIFLSSFKEKAFGLYVNSFNKTAQVIDRMTGIMANIGSLPPSFKMH